MRRSGLWHIVAAFGLCLGLSACNTTDALTPQVDVGGGTFPSSAPVTQDETERMAGTDRLESVQSAPLAAPGSQQGSQPISPGRAARPGDADTLGGQAQALANGAPVSPAYSGPPPQWQGQGEGQGELEGRSGTDTANSGGQPDMGEQMGAAPDTSPGEQPAPSAPQAASASGETIRFLPIIGAPVQAVTPLSRQLAASARAAGLTIRPSGDTGTNQILKGYFSALSDGNKVTMVYVWDVLDNAGARLHRLQGQETMPAAGSDPWDAVSPELMQQIAKKTIADYMNWRQTQ